ncbi:hypothetical protein L3Q82_014689 [Scortum barcoo]|uniref:Uncharacterized protein n=1 Tax=Scortum barcoo TaxID=214431 RepID=A0ACB8VRJ5_9TELE|nr:hypothetical protein L3Q82_014689 [Scortum barcoo]
MHKKACKQFAEDKQTKDMDYWNHVQWSDETKINLLGSDGSNQGKYSNMINDPKHTSKTTTALLKKLRVKVLDWAKHVSRPKPY